MSKKFKRVNEAFSIPGRSYGILGNTPYADGRVVTANSQPVRELEIHLVLMRQVIDRAERWLTLAKKSTVDG